MKLSTAALAISLFAIVITGCSSLQDKDTRMACVGSSCEPTTQSVHGRQYIRYQYFNRDVAGNPGILPPNEQLHPDYHNMTPVERRGLAGWHLFDGKGRFLQEIAIASHGTNNVLKVLDSCQRNTRFDQYGVISDPGCRIN